MRPEGHTLGAERERWERVFPPQLADRMQELLQTLPAGERSARRRRIVTDVLAALPDGFPAADASEAVLRTAASRFEELVAGLAS